MIARRLLALMTLVLCAACSTSRVDSSWTDPGQVGKPLPFTKVIAVALFKEGATRRIAEDHIAQAINTHQAGRVTATPSYEILDARDLDKVDEARVKVAEGGYDGAVIVSIVSSEQRIRTTPGVSMGGAYGYGSRWGMMYDTAEIRSDTVVHVQTNIYAVRDARLVWSATSKALNPSDVADLIDDTIGDVGAALREQGLVPSPSP